jgi:hypothetical protein
MNWDIVNEIRYGVYKYTPVKELARIFNCGEHTIKDVINSKTWK